MNIKENIERIKSETYPAKLVAVTKTRSIEEIKKAVGAGVKIIAENRIQEAESKYDVLEDFLKKNNVEFHFIGHLQSNKTKQAVKMFDMIQSIDSEKIAKAVNKWAGEMGKVQDVLAQVNIGKEEQKHGIMPEHTIEFVNKISLLNNIRIRGLMCIPPFFKDAEKTRPYFQEMKKIFDSTNLELLSMGMTNDYKIAIEEGSNMVRIGTGIFRERIK